MSAKDNGGKVTLADYVSEFRLEESNYIHTAVMILDDKDSQKVLAAWSTMPMTWVRPKSAVPESGRERWDWLWRGVKMDFEEYSIRTGIASSRLQKLFGPLKSARLVYPDGSIAEHAMNVLKAEVQRAIRPIVGEKK